MDFSTDYLDQILDSAIEFYHLKNQQPEIMIPDKMNSPIEALNIFTNSLKQEAHRSFLVANSDHKEPLLHTVDLDSESPGIIVDIDKKNNKVKVYNHHNLNKPKKIKKPKKYKDQQDIEQQANIQQQALEQKNQQLADKQQNKQDEKQIKQINKQAIKLQKSIDKNKLQEQQINEEIKQLEQDDLTDTKQYQQKNKKKEQLEEKNNQYQKEIEQQQQQSKIYEERMKKYQQAQELKKIEQQARKEARELSKQEKNQQKNLEQKTQIEVPLETQSDEQSNILLKRQTEEIQNENVQPIIKEDQEKEKEKISDNKKNKSKKIKLNKVNQDNITDELYDVINQYKEDQGLESSSTEVLHDLNQVKLFPCPIPFQRHLHSLYQSNPNPILLPTLLYGNQQIGSESIKIIHGPPGTGKTSRLIKELKEILDLNPRERVLLCAPSNIGVINLYQRAISFGITGCLILASNKLPPGYQLPEKPGKDNIIFTTISMRFGKILDKCKFTKIIMDEASQCQEAWTWGLLRSEVNQLIMAGDPDQLPSLVTEQGEKFKYNRSLMERLMQIEVKSELLNIQRRMHPLIAQFSNQQYYQHRLQTDYQGNFNLDPVKIINIEGQETKDNNSYYNLEEIKEINNQFSLLSQHFKEVIVICPYQAQCQKLKTSNSSIPVHTVDSFQGKEAEAVIICTVRTGNSVGFWNDYRRLNVALTRAKHALRIIGNLSTWQSEKGPLNDFYMFGKENNMFKL